tara:strand:+ start:284 stop:661 length:378 start_codon:yes stop_codon:yes gene_type:complete
MKLIFENWRKHIKEEEEDLNFAAMIDKVNQKLEDITNSPKFQGRDVQMYIEDITKPGDDSTKIQAIQQNSEQDVVAISEWDDFPEFLKLFNHFIDGDRPDLVMFDLDEASNMPPERRAIEYGLTT